MASAGTSVSKEDRAGAENEKLANTFICFLASIRSKVKVQFCKTRVEYIFTSQG